MSAVTDLAPFGLSQANTINMSADEYAKQAAAYRKALQQRLLEQGQEQFSQANPFILEDLNSRGFATSPTETANTQSRYLADIALKNNQALSAFDTDAFNQESNLRQQAAMTPLELERMGIERDYALADQARQESLSRELADQQSKDAMTSGLLGLGGNLLQGYTMSKMLGGGAAGASAGGSGGAGASAGGGAGGMGAAIAGRAASALGGAYVGQKLNKNAFGEKGRNDKAVSRGMKVGAGAGATIGSVYFGPLGAVIGGTVGGFVGGNVGKATRTAVGGKAINAKNLLTGGKKFNVQNVAKAPVTIAKNAFKKAFCFTPGTMIEMADGTMKPIESITLGENVNGGQVYSIRMSMTDPGQIYNYLGTNVTGTHAVKENGVWTRVENSAFGIKTDLPGPVISLVTENHRIHSNGTEFADEFEHDNYEEITMDESLKLLNAKEFAHA